MRTLLALALLASLAAGCTDDEGRSASPPPTPTAVNPGILPQPDEVSVEVSSVGAYPATPAFDPVGLQVPAGALVHVTFRNEDANPLVPHNWVVEGIEGASSDTIDPGQEDTFDFTAPLEPGEHTYYCSLQGHREAGMEGTLSVTVS